MLNPPSLWPDVPSSQIPTPSDIERDIKKILSTARNKIDDIMNVFLELYNINYTNLKENLINNKRDFVCPVVALWDENILILQSIKVIDGISLFMSTIYKNL